DQVRAGRQPQDRQGDRAHDPRIVLAARRRGDRMTRAPIHRRSFLTLLGGASAAAWPLKAHAQQTQHMRRIGVFMSAPPGDRVPQADAAIMLQGLRELGWTAGRNLQIEWRWYEANAAQARKDAEDLVALGPDLIVAISGPVLAALVRAG